MQQKWVWLSLIGYESRVVGGEYEGEIFNHRIIRFAE
jgi:hypothetical protein